MSGEAVAIAGAVIGKVTSGRIWPFLIVVPLPALPIVFFVVILLTWSDT